jgi:RNA polymerase sigma factor (sigma-70 family)
MDSPKFPSWREEDRSEFGSPPVNQLASIKSMAEETLAPLAQELSQEELDRFVKTVRPTIERYVAKRVRNRDHAEEIVSRVFEALVRSWGAFRGDCPTEAYVVFIAANALKNYYSRDLQKISVQISLDDWVETFSLQHDTDLACPYRRLDTASWVDSLLREMKNCCSQVECGVVGMFYQGQTLDEISSLTGMNAATVRGHFLRARKKLLGHLYLEAPQFLGGEAAVLAVVDRMERTQPDMFSNEEISALRSRKGTAELIRGAMLKIAPFLDQSL